MNKIRIFGVVVLVCLTICFAPAAQAQLSELGSITGTVTDAKGGVIPNVAITITNTDQNVVVKTATTDKDGTYNAELLPVGHYSVTAEITGFKKSTQTGITLHAAEKLTVNLTLEVGTVSEVVTVEANALQIETRSATPTGVVTGTQIRNLALNTRNYEQLVTLMPGVSGSNLNQLYIGNSVPGGTVATVPFSINGQRNSSNYWTIDGVDNVDRGSDLTLGNFPSVDALTEFTVQKSLYDAEFGRAGGATINVITKSGANQFHGDAYEFFRNNDLNANNFFNNAAKPQIPIAPLRYNDFGYTIGGPIWKNHTFFFFSEEFRRVITYGTVSASEPTPAMLTGNFQNNVCVAYSAVTGLCTTNSNTISPATFNPAATAYIKDLWSKFAGPNNPPVSIFSLFSPLRNIFNARQELVRIDHTFNTKFSVFGRYEHDSIPTVEPGGLFTGDAFPNVGTTDTNSPGWQAMAHYTYTISANWLNDGGYGYNYSAIVSNPVGLDASANSPDVVAAITLPFKSTLARIPGLSISNISGIASFGPYRDFNRDQDAFDNMTWIRGRHTVRFGFSYNHYQKTENAGGNNTGGFSFPQSPAPLQSTLVGTINPVNMTPNCITSSGICNTEQAWANFLLGSQATFSQLSQDAVADIRDQQWEFYGQDEIRLKSNLTLTVGLRYSRFGAPYTGNGQLQNFDPALYNPANAPAISYNGQLCLVGNCPGGTTYPAGGTITNITPNPNYDPLNGFIIAGSTAFGHKSPYGNAVTNTDNRDFAPRVGLVWDPFKDGKTSVRAGYGIFYDSTLFGIYEQNLFNDPPFTTSLTTLPGAPFTNPSAGTASVSASTPNLGGSGSAAMEALPWHTPYSQQWSLDVQRQVRKDLTIDVGYYGNNAHHLLGVEDFNQPHVGVGAADGLSCGTHTVGLTDGQPFGTACTGASPAQTTIFTSGNFNRENIIRPFTGYAEIAAIAPRFNSNYHSLQAQMTKRWGQNSLFILNYTWSHNLTNNASDRSNAPQDMYNVLAEYGPSALDRRYNVTANYVYSLPWFKGQEGFAGHALGGWVLSGIIVYYSGTPLTVTTSSVDPGGIGCPGSSPISCRPDLTGNPNLPGATFPFFFNTAVFSAVPNGQVRNGDSGRGIITGARYQTWNLAVFKDTKIHGESNYVEFRLESTNTFNHTNFNCCGSTNNTSSLFGKITSANDPRIVQLALKLYF